MSKKALMLNALANRGSTSVEDVFSTQVRVGTSAENIIVNGIDLSGEGGLVWVKWRSGSNAFGHALYDTERGANKQLVSNTAVVESTESQRLNSFNGTGYTLGSNTETNYAADKYVDWTFRKAARFFDVVTYTGTGSAHAISHALGVAPGMILVKNRDTTDPWKVYHRSNTAGPETDYLVLNTTAATVDEATIWNDTAPSSTQFTVGTHVDVNTNTEDYVAYLFAHDPLGPSGDGSDGLIACGSYSGSSSTVDVTLGWEPQYIMVKQSGETSSWEIYDTMRGMPQGYDQAFVIADGTNAETGGNNWVISPTGFGARPGATAVNAGVGKTHIYMAIRRPMKTPEAGTEVFALSSGDGTPLPYYDASFPVDMAFHKVITSAVNAYEIGSRLTQGRRLNTTVTAAESAETSFKFDYMNGWNSETSTSATNRSWMFKRAPGFFDVVAYAGNSANGRLVNHNLAVEPEWMVVKNRTSVKGWFTGGSHLGWDMTGRLDTTAAYFDNGFSSYITAGSTTTFTVNDNSNVNNTGSDYIAYLFATLAGISKVGSFTGNGSNQTIDCGFSGGARFVLVKRTDATGDWFFWDTLRGIVAGNDSHLSLNTTAAEVTSDDSVDPANSGFIVNQVSATNINVSSATYIFLAIA